MNPILYRILYFLESEQILYAVAITFVIVVVWLALIWPAWEKIKDEVKKIKDEESSESQD